MKILNKSKLKQNAAIGFNRSIQQLSKPVRWIWPHLSEAAIGLFALLMVAFCLATYYPQLTRFASELITKNKYMALMDGLFNPFRNKHILLKSGLPIYDLKISSQEYARIEASAQLALKKGYMSEDLKTWVNAQFICGTKNYNVKVRVRGDLSPHWEGPKKSWRIKFGKELLEYNGEIREEPIYFKGKRQINLIIPKDRDYILAYFVNSLMRDSGLIVPRDGFAILRINGVIHGLYYEVEHFDKPLFAAQKRPETTVFGQNDRAMHFEQYTKYGIPIASDARYDLGTMSRSVEVEGQLAMRAMQVLIDHSIHPSPGNFSRVLNVLDWEKYLRFRAITTLFNTNHVRFGSDNFRLYYDPSRGKLEPIPWDVHLVKMPKEPGTVDFWNNHGPDEIQRATLEDPMLRLQRNLILWDLVKNEGQDFIERYDEIHNRIRPLAWADVLNTPVQGHKMDQLRDNLKFNVRRVHKVMALSTANLTYKLESDTLASLETVVTNFSGIRLNSFELSDSLDFGGAYRLYEDSNGDGEFDKADQLIGETTVEGLANTIRFKLQKLLFPEIKYDNDIIGGRYWEFYDTLSGRYKFFLVGKLASADRDPILWSPPQIRIDAENAVTGLRMASGFINPKEASPTDYFGITAYDASDPYDLDAPDYTMAQFLDMNQDFSISPDRPAAVQLQGTVTISNTVIVPKSVMLIIQPGTVIRMKPRANILCYGGLQAVGTIDKNISIVAADPNKPFGTVAIVRPPQTVVIKHTEFSGGGQSQVNGMLFTGGFAVYDGDLVLEDSRFINMESEDGFNLKNGKLMAKNCLFSNSSSDGVDIDFGTGYITNSQFIDIKGDGLDLSGSTISISSCYFENVADKGISVGENSHPLIFNSLFLNCTIGLSTKDLSLAKVAHATFVGNQLAIEAKRKKPFFGGGSGEFINCVFSGNRKLLSEDVFSAGKVSLAHSILDVAVEWKTCQTIMANFRSPLNHDFSIDKDSLGPNKSMITMVDWAKEFTNGQTLVVPGVLPDLIEKYRGQQRVGVK